MSIIVSLTAMFAVTLPMLRTRAQRAAAKADISQFQVGAASYQQEWSQYPSSGNSAFVGAMREGTRRGAAHARLVTDRIQQIGIDEDGANQLKLSGSLDPDADTVTVAPAQLLPAFTDPETGKPLPMQYGAVKIDKEWITFTAVDDGTFRNCRRGQFATNPAQHSGGVEVIMYQYLDPWGTPYAYTRAKDYGKEGTDQVLTQTGACGGDGCDPRFTNEPTGSEAVQYCYENCGEFQVVSAGPDKKFYRIKFDGQPVDPKQKDDDIRNW